MRQRKKPFDLSCFDNHQSSFLEEILRKATSMKRPVPDKSSSYIIYIRNVLELRLAKVRQKHVCKIVFLGVWLWF